MIWNIWKKKEWLLETLPAISGKQAGLQVTVYNFPCRKEKGKEHRKYPYADFGAEFIDALMNKQLADFSTISAALTCGESVEVSVRLRELPAMRVVIQGRPHPHENQFSSDVADALIDAFNKSGIKP
jgi:hypothetical protein